MLETSYGWEVWTYGGVILPNINKGVPSSSSLQKLDYFSVSGRECLGGRIMDPKARYWYCKTGTYPFLIFRLWNFMFEGKSYLNFSIKVWGYFKLNMLK